MASVLYRLFSAERRRLIGNFTGKVKARLSRCESITAFDQTTLVRDPVLVAHFLLFYDFSEIYEAKRASVRNAHLEKAWAAAARGDLILAGALTEPVDTGVLLFMGSGPEVAERFATDDPYVINGLVRRWHVREWSTVVSEGATSPLRP